MELAPGDEDDDLPGDAEEGEEDLGDHPSFPPRLSLWTTTTTRARSEVPTDFEIRVCSLARAARSGSGSFSPCVAWGNQDDDDAPSVRHRARALGAMTTRRDDDDDDDDASVRSEVGDALRRLGSAVGVGTSRGDDDEEEEETADAMLTRLGMRASFDDDRRATDAEVRSVLASMYRVALGGDAAGDEARDGDGDDDRDGLSSSSALRSSVARSDASSLSSLYSAKDAPYVISRGALTPPWYAKSYYKVVAVVGPGGPRGDAYHYVSVYDGVTRYDVGSTVCHPAAPGHGGGLYVSPTIEGCLRRDKNMFPRNSMLLNAPRAIAKCRCWNERRETDPVFYGTKLAFTFARVDEILPYPSTWGVNIDGAGVTTWTTVGPLADEVARASYPGPGHGAFDPNGKQYNRDVPAAVAPGGSVYRPPRSPATSARRRAEELGEEEEEDAPRLMRASFDATAARSGGLGGGLGGVERASASRVDDAVSRIVRRLEAKALGDVENTGERDAAARVGKSGRNADAAERRSVELVKAQATTIALEEEVRAMERRLDATRYGAGVVANIRA